MYKRRILKRLVHVEDKLDQVLDRLQLIAQMEVDMSKELDDLAVQVAANTDAEQSAIVLLGTLSDLLKAAANDPVAIRKLATDLDGSKVKLADAILANTPPAPPPPP